MSLDFEGQRPGEKVLFIFRRHISTTRKGIFFLLTMTILGFVPVLIWRDIDWMVFIWMGFVLLGLVGWGYAYILWYFSLYVVTDQRLRQISQKGLFKKSVVDLGLDKIQSISYSIPGFFASMSGYGTILIQTMVGDLVISNVGKPEKVYNKLQNAAKLAEDAKVVESE
ncbi:MAG: PH domain-containing protein [Candidatus Saccharimonadales bacterium]